MMACGEILLDGHNLVRRSHTSKDAADGKQDRAWNGETEGVRHL